MVDLSPCVPKTRTRIDSCPKPVCISDASAESSRTRSLSFLFFLLPLFLDEPAIFNFPLPWGSPSRHVTFLLPRVAIELPRRRVQFGHLSSRHFLLHDKFRFFLLFFSSLPLMICFSFLDCQDPSPCFFFLPEPVISTYRSPSRPAVRHAMRISIFSRLFRPLYPLLIPLLGGLFYAISP